MTKAKADKRRVYAIHRRTRANRYSLLNFNRGDISSEILLSLRKKGTRRQKYISESKMKRILRPNLPIQGWWEIRNITLKSL